MVATTSSSDKLGVDSSHVEDCCEELSPLILGRVRFVEHHPQTPKFKPAQAPEYADLMAGQSLPVYRKASTKPAALWSAITTMMGYVRATYGGPAHAQ